MQEVERSVLEHYDMSICSTRKIRGAVLCDTNKGIYLLKEITVSSERMELLGELYEHLENQSWCGVDKLIKNQEGTYCTVLENGNKYIIKRWFSGKECDIRKPGELLEAAGMLAKFHLHLQKELKNPVVNTESLITEYEKHNRELKKIRTFIRKRTPKSKFEKCFLDNFVELFARAEAASDMLKKSNYEKLYNESIEMHCLTHGEYNYHNIIMKTEDNSNEILALTNFEKFKNGIQIEDFYYLLRKVMEKYGWKERLGDGMINAYSAVKPLTENEIEYMKNRLLYPEKFWKTANAYYVSNKAWMPVKNLEKLETAIWQTKEKERFLGNIFGNVLEV